MHFSAEKYPVVKKTVKRIPQTYLRRIETTYIRAMVDKFKKNFKVNLFICFVPNRRRYV